MITQHKHSDLMINFNDIETGCDKALPDCNSWSIFGIKNDEKIVLNIYGKLYLPAQDTMRTINNRIKNHIISLIDNL